MALAVNFRWNVPKIDVSNAEQQSRAEGFDSLSKGIRTAMDRGRRNRIEDEDRQRRIDEEERRKAGFRELSGMMQGKSAERDSLLARKATLEQEIADLKAQLGG